MRSNAKIEQRHLVFGQYPPRRAFIDLMADRKLDAIKILKDRNAPIRIPRRVSHDRKLYVGKIFRQNICDEHDDANKRGRTAVMHNGSDQPLFQLLLCLYRHGRIRNGFETGHRDFFSADVAFAVGIVLDFF